MRDGQFSLFVAVPAGQTIGYSLLSSASFLKAASASVFKYRQQSDHAGHFVPSSAFDQSPDNSLPPMLRLALPLCPPRQPSSAPPSALLDLGVQPQLLPQFVSEAKPAASWSPSLRLAHTQTCLCRHKHSPAGLGEKKKNSITADRTCTGTTSCFKQ